MAVSTSQGVQIRVTPFLDGDSVCTLLEIGAITILLDCGSSFTSDLSLLSDIQTELLRRGKEIDAILISHADVYHIGSLPTVFGRKGMVPKRVLCSLPVHKFGQLLLYDLYLNKEMEGQDEDTTGPSKLSFDLDDVDYCFKNVTTIKFSQPLKIFASDGQAGQQEFVSLTVHPSGRTIGGSIWHIRAGVTDVLYVVDANLRKEVVLDGAALDVLPTVPAVLIMDSGASSGSMISGSGLGCVVSGAAMAKTRKREKDNSSLLTSTVMEAMRADGNVLLPCETASRTLEVLQILASHWAVNKLGMYHLVYLSHMASNVLEFSRSQLEWMSESLSKNFYSGKANPFEIPQVKVCSSVRELEVSYPGPKVVLATDATLSYGLAKELLLRWGGDPRCRVIFTDTISAPDSLASDLRVRSTGGTAPLVTTVTRPLRVQLSGDELVAYMREQEARKKAAEEEAYRARLAEELQMLAEADKEEPDIDDEEEQTEEGENSMGIAAVAGATAATAVATLHKKRKEVQSALISKFARPSFPMFETRDVGWVVDDYGASIADLKFLHDDTTISAAATSRLGKDTSGGKGDVLAVKKAGGTSSGIVSSTDGAGERAVDIGSTGLEDVIPTKLISTTVRVQFTIGIKEISLAGRMDSKAVKTILSKVTPTRVLFLRNYGSDLEKNALESFAKGLGAEVYRLSARDGSRSKSFRVLPSRVQLQLPQALLAHIPSRSLALTASSTSQHAFSLAPFSNQGSSGTESCQVSVIDGPVKELANSGIEGVKRVLLMSTTRGAAAAGLSEDVSSLLHDPGCAVDVAESSSVAVSAGEVMLSSLKQRIEQRGIKVEFRLGSETGSVGGALLCDGQVVIRKDMSARGTQSHDKESGNSFLIEGPPVAAYYEARKILYENFAFV